MDAGPLTTPLHAHLCLLQEGVFTTSLQRDFIYIEAMWWSRRRTLIALFSRAPVAWHFNWAILAIRIPVIYRFIIRPNMNSLFGALFGPVRIQIKCSVPPYCKLMAFLGVVDRELSWLWMQTTADISTNLSFIEHSLPSVCAVTLWTLVKWNHEQLTLTSGVAEKNNYKC